MPGQFFRLEQTFPVICHLFRIQHTFSLYAKRHAHQYLVRLSLFVSPLSRSLSFRPLPSSSPSIRPSLSFSPPSHLPLFLASSSPSRSFFVQRTRFVFPIIRLYSTSLAHHQPRVRGWQKRGIDRRNCAGVATPPHTAVPLA